MRQSADNMNGNGSARQDDDNKRVLLIAGLSLAIAFLMASFYPPVLMMAVFSTLAMIMALGAAFTGFVLGQRPFRGSLNLWDKAAVMLLISLGTGFFVDVQAIQAFVEAQEAGGAASAAAVTGEETNAAVSAPLVSTPAPPGPLL